VTPQDGARARVRAILFDLDGTLIDSSVVVERHWRRFASLHHLDVEPILAVCHGRRSIDTIREVAPHLDAEAAARELDDGEALDVDGLALVPGAADLLACLAPDTWAIVTSGHFELASRRLEALGLPVPPVMVCAEDVEHGKPDPEGYARAAELLGVEPDACVVVEDAPAGIAAGRALGAAVIGVATTHAPQELAADVVVPDLEGLDVLLVALGFELPQRSVRRPS
jgi:sugar-phosphatase